MKKVLFIHHGSIAGGAPLSLLYTALGVKEEGYIPEVALVSPSKELHQLYNKYDIKTHEIPYVPFYIVWSSYCPNAFSFNGVRDIIKTALRWKISQNKFCKFIVENNYDLIHLNSVGLSNLAQFLLKNKLPFVWHVREQGPVHKGLRYQFIHNLLKKSKNVIFLSHAEKKSWGCKEHGNVIHNFIDFSQFDYKKNSERDTHREKYGIDKDDFVILFLGGLKAHKGTELLVKAGKLLIGNNSNIKVLMPDSLKKTSFYKKRGGVKKIVEWIKHHVIGLVDYGSHIDNLIKDYELTNNFIRLGFNPNSVHFFVCADIVVFPASKPHFARPIIEASAMKKPVVASDFEVMQELVEDSKTGYLFESGNVAEFTNLIEILVRDSRLRETMGKNAYIKAKKEFNQSTQIELVLDIYSSAINDMENL